VELWIKSSSASAFPLQAAALKAQAAADSRIHWLETLLPQQQMEQFWLQADALVSLHRAEGFGLAIAEAMAMGLPVIATGYSGNLEFSPVGSCCLIPWQPQPIPHTAGDYPAGAIWAEPDLDAAAQAMQQLAANHKAAHALGDRGRQAAQEPLLAPARLTLRCAPQQQAPAIAAVPLGEPLRVLRSWCTGSGKRWLQVELAGTRRRGWLPG
jgi:glycosyltransferase involved in cell wall biosynthesis